MFTKVTYNPLQGILSILSVVAHWKIFEDRGEAGWKALIPFYSTYTLGKVCDDTKNAKRSILCLILLLVSVFAFMFFFAIGMSSSDIDFNITDINDINGIVITNTPSDISFTGNPLPLFLFGMLSLLFLVLLVVFDIKLHRHFDLFNNGPSWMIILWIFFPAGAALYYAFIHKNYNIPGITEKEEYDPDNYIDQQ